jgi:dipeptidyl aminopeptidase/acylaminoacyl peptidase
MIRANVLLLAALVAAADAKAPRRYTIEQFLSTTTFTELAFSPDEREVLFTSDETGIPNVYTKPIAGGDAVPITRSTTDTTFAVSFFPGDGRILYTHDRGGDENNHLYVRERDGSERDLTPGYRLKAAFVKWAADKRSFFVATNERDPRFFDVYRVAAAGYGKKLFFKNEGFDVADISPDEHWIALNKPATSLDADVYLHDVRTDETRRLFPHTAPTSYVAHVFDPESRYLYYRTDEGGEFSRLRRYGLATGKSEEVEKADWDILDVALSETGRYRATMTNADARIVMRIVDTRTGKPVELPSLPPGEITTVRFSPSENLIAFYLSGDRSPANLYVYDFRTGKVTRLTDALGKELAGDDLVDAEVVRFRASDGLTIPSVLYKPREASAEHKVPALVWVHGGPGGQTRHGYSSLIQFLVNHGYAVLGINNRGSNGYGKTFYAADDRRHGREPLRDCVEAKEFLGRLPYIDGDKVAIIGRSYGGYMVLAALTLQPEVFAAGVDSYGISNWVRTLESIPAYWETQRLQLYKEIGDPRADRQMLLEVSPLFHADRIKRPLMILQGANDARVPKAESDDIVAAARRNGVPVEYVVFPDEGHGFKKKANQVKGWQATLDFLDRYVKNRPARAAGQ